MVKPLRALTSEQETGGDVAAADDALPPAQGDIPAATWRLLQEAGHVAAERLHDLLANDKGWKRLKPADQARLIELAFNRAYGPPIKRQARLELSGRVSDAVADSLASLSAIDLPEYGRSANLATAEQAQDVAEGVDTGEAPSARQRAAQRRARKI